MGIMINAREVIATTMKLIQPSFRDIAHRDGTAIRAQNARGIVHIRVINGQHLEARYSVSDLEKKLSGIPPEQKMVGLRVGSKTIQFTVPELRRILGKE